MGPLGWQETLVIFIVALLIFGPKKLPELGKTVGKAMSEFRKASNELKGTWQREMAEIEREGQSIRKTTREITNDIANQEYDYDYDDQDGELVRRTNAGSTTTNQSTVSASATQGAESTAKTSDATTQPASAKPDAGAGSTTSSGNSPESKAVPT